MKIVNIDIETYSSVPLRTQGLYRYVEAPDFEVLLISYLYEGELRTVDLRRSALPDLLHYSLLQALARNSDVEFRAFNAAFERVCLRGYDGLDIPAHRWRCTAVAAAYCGLPGDLDSVSRVLKLKTPKLATGTALIRKFCVPQANGTRLYPEDDPEAWAHFIEYNRQDVRAEAEAAERIYACHPLPEHEWRLYALDQEVNDRGVYVDLPLVEQAIRVGNDSREALMREAAELSGLDNPNSVAQLKNWLSMELSQDSVSSLTKKDIPLLAELAEDQGNSHVARVLEIRRELSKSSVRKYDAFRRYTSADSRLRGSLQFYGAARTGRWSGRGVQPHNLAKNTMTELDAARRVVRLGEHELVDMLFDNTQDTLSQLVRTAFAAPEGRVLYSCDFSAIEARMLAWLAGEQWRLDVFNTHGRIYEASASAMFKVPWDEFERHIREGRKHPLRQKGKVAELALGYWGGVNALITMGALTQGLDEDELPGIVSSWREANPAIGALVKSIDTAAKRCVQTREPAPVVGCAGQVLFRYASGLLLMRLPSGRELAYASPRIERKLIPGRVNSKGEKVTDAWETEVVTYKGLDPATRRWARLDGYGGKWVENLCQAASRDILAHKLLDAGAWAQHLVLHVHDEAVFELPQDRLEAATVEIPALFAKPVPWAPGLPLAGDGFASPYYRKED